MGLFVFCLFILKAHGLRSMGLGVLNVVRLFKKPHPAQWVGSRVFILKAHGLRSMGLLCFLIFTEKYSNILSISSSIMLLIN